MPNIRVIQTVTFTLDLNVPEGMSLDSDAFRDLLSDEVECDNNRETSEYEFIHDGDRRLQGEKLAPRHKVVLEDDDAALEPFDPAEEEVVIEAASPDESASPSGPERLWKTTAEIWTDYDPSVRELEDLAREATSGDAICTTQVVEMVTDRAKFPQTEFFDVG